MSTDAKTRHCKRGVRTPNAIFARRQRRIARRSILDARTQSKPWNLRCRARSSSGVPIPSPLIAKDPCLSSAHASSSTPTTRCMSFATFNVRTLSSLCRQKELATLVKDRNCLFIAIQEHRLSHGDSTRQVTLENGCSFLSSSASPAGVGGIGFMCHPLLDLKYSRIVSHSSRIMQLSFQMFGRIVHAFSVYSPTAAHPIDAGFFYAELSSIIASLPSRDIVVVAGDMNACATSALFRIGRNVNGNSDLLSDFINCHHLTPLNATYRKKASRRATFIGPNDRTERLDYILTNCPRLFRNCDTLAPYAIPSDHRLVFADVKHQLRTRQSHRKRQVPNWLALPSVADAFADHLDAILVNDPPENDFDKVSNAIVTTANAILPVKQGSGSSSLSWDSDAGIIEARKRLRRATHAMRHESSGQNVTDARDRSFREHSKALADAHEQCVNRHFSEIIDAVKDASDANKHRVAWHHIKRLRKRASPSLHVDAANATEARLKIRAHFFALLNPPAGPSSSDPLVSPPDFSAPELSSFNTSPVTLSELDSALKAMRPFAAPGADMVPVIALRFPSIQRELLAIINAMLSGMTAPAQWRRAILISIPKNASTQLEQQRGISLMSTSAKAYNKVIQRRVSPTIDPFMRHNQNGGRQDRGTTSQILSLRILIEGCRSHQKNIVVTFIDFKKAFDSVLRSKIDGLLSMFNVPPVLIRAIMSMYCSTSSFVRSHYGDSDDFPTSCGVLQGDTLAPFLFNLFIDYVLCHACPFGSGFTLNRRRSSRHPEKRLADLDFVDDIAVVSDNIEDAQRTLTEIERVGSTVGLKINAAKTKFIAIGSEQAQLFTSEGPVERVESFKYLGSTLPSSSDDISCRRGMAWSALGDLKRFWSSSAPPDLKLCLFRSTIEPVFLYACESWFLTDTLSRQINQTYDHLLRHALGVHYPMVITTVELRQMTPSASAIAQQRRLRFIGHVMRSKDRSPQPLHDILEWKPTELHRRGFANLYSYRDVLVSDCLFTGVPLSSVNNRSVWKRVL